MVRLIFNLIVCAREICYAVLKDITAVYYESTSFSATFIFTAFAVVLTPPAYLNNQPINTKQTEKAQAITIIVAPASAGSLLDGVS